MDLTPGGAVYHWDDCGEEEGFNKIMCLEKFQRKEFRPMFLKCWVTTQRVSWGLLIRVKEEV